MFRTLFLLLCLAALVGAFLYSARPQWFEGLTARAKIEPPPMMERKATLILPVGGKAPMSPDGVDVRQIIDTEDDGLPSRVVPYIMVVNSQDKTIRHYRLTANVKSVKVRTLNPDVVTKQSKVLNSNGPLQYEFWIPTDRELMLEIEYSSPKR